MDIGGFITPESRDLVKPVSPQLVEKFCAFYGARQLVLILQDLF
jgi:hypothetical protein